MKSSTNNNGIHQPMPNNIATAAGIIRSAPKEIVKNHGILMYKGDISIPKPNGLTEYCIPYQLRTSLLMKEHIGSPQLFKGECRTRNDKTSGNLQLKVYFQIKEIFPLENEKYLNEVCIIGHLCSQPFFKSKKTANGTMAITSATLAVHRQNKFSDYLPCSFYGSVAYQLKNASVGSKYLIHGRMVNRQYYHYGEEKTAYELQVYQATALSC